MVRDEYCKGNEQIFGLNRLRYESRKKFIIRVDGILAEYGFASQGSTIDEKDRRVMQVKYDGFGGDRVIAKFVHPDLPDWMMFSDSCGDLIVNTLETNAKTPADSSIYFRNVPNGIVEWIVEELRRDIKDLPSSL